MPVMFDSCVRCGKVTGGGAGAFCTSCQWLFQRIRRGVAVNPDRMLRVPGPLPVGIIGASRILDGRLRPCRVAALVSHEGVDVIADWMISRHPYLAGPVIRLGPVEVRHTDCPLAANEAILLAWRVDPPEFDDTLDPVGYVGAVGVDTYRVETFRPVTPSEWLTAKSDALYELRRLAGR